MPNANLHKVQVNLCVDLRVIGLLLKIFIRASSFAALTPEENIHAQKGIELLTAIAMRSGYMTEREILELYDSINLVIGRVS